MDLTFIYQLIDTDVIIDYIFDQIDKLLMAGKFSEVDCILSQVDVSRMTVDGMLAFLTITLSARNKLNNRTAYGARVQQRLASVYSPKRLQRIMDRLI